MQEHFLLPDRYEGLETTMEPRDIPKIIVPVDEAIAKVDEIYEEMASSGRGAFLVLKGSSGCGKTTFLRTLSIFMENIEVVTFGNEVSIHEKLDSLSTSNKQLRIVVIEGRESILDMRNEEVTNAIHKINSFIRSKAGINTLVVWPCNNEDIVTQLVETSKVVGGTALLGSQDSYYEFPGPPKNEYLNIVEQTIGILNHGKNLQDFGISNDIAKEWLSDASTIGEYLKVVGTKIRANKNLVKRLNQKERCKLWVVVLALNEPSKDVEAITKGESLDADIQRMLVSTDANIVQEVKQHPEQIALASNYLNCKVIYISIVEALYIVRNYADAKLKKIMKEQNLSTASDKDVASRLSNTELVRMINSDTKLKGRKGVVGSKSKEAFDKLLLIAENNDTILNRTFGEALKVNGYVDQYETEQDFGVGLTRRTDLLCKKSNENLRLEFMWRKKTSKAEISNYVLTKLYNYSKALGLF